MEVITMTLGEKLKNARKNAGLSQEQLAEQLGVSRQAISKWESGVSVPESDKLVAISDATMASGMPDGQYWIGQSPIVVENGFSHTNEGRLAGTTTLLDDGWHSLMNYANTDETYAAGSVSINPARSLGLTDRGCLLPGTRADMAIFEQGTNRLLMTICCGEIVYCADDVKPSRTPEIPAEDV
jgi:N-acetylglucosamine-6-phosphate deacetylase